MSGRQSGELDHAIVFLTHIEVEPIYNHFLRLREQTRGLLDTFLCVHQAAQSNGAAQRLPAHFRITESDGARRLPNRYKEYLERGGAILPGFSDLACMPALLSSRLAGYRYIWFVEYDVDYAGHWMQFFALFMDNDADLLGTHIVRRSYDLDWCHWSWFNPPPFIVPQHMVRGFLPIARFSRRMLDCYFQAVSDGGWRGHTEAIYPTIASSSGLVIEDIGGWGQFTPSRVRGLNYLGSADSQAAATFLPFLPSAIPRVTYFHETPEQFTKPVFLYHPVKVQDRTMQGNTRR